MNFAAFTAARWNGVPGTSIGIEMIPEANTWNESSNFLISAGFSRLTNSLAASHRVYFFARGNVKISSFSRSQSTAKWRCAMVSMTPT